MNTTKILNLSSVSILTLAALNVACVTDAPKAGLTVSSIEKTSEADVSSSSHEFVAKTDSIVTDYVPPSEAITSPGSNATEQAVTVVTTQVLDPSYEASADSSESSTGEAIEGGNSALSVRSETTDTKADLQPISLPFNATLHFPSGGTELTAEDLELIKTEAVYLAANPNWRVVIQGHTDQQGSLAYNLKLSDRRAEVVRQSLLNAGAKPDQMSIEAYGPLMPLKNASTSDENRRVELIFQLPTQLSLQ